MNKISRRNFIRASALSALGAAAAGALSGCSNNAASSAAASSVASSAAASEQPAAAASSITWDDIFATSYSQANRRSNPDAKAPETPEEYIEQKGLSLIHIYHGDGNGAGDHGQVEHAAEKAGGPLRQVYDGGRNPQGEDAGDGHRHDDDDKGVFQCAQEDGVSNCLLYTSRCV